MRSTSSASSKGQIPQMFIFIMAMLVIGATVFIGVKLLGGLEGTACKANDAAFQKEMKGLLDDRATYGLRDTVLLSNPCDAAQICFVDARDIGNTEFSAPSLSVVQTSVRNGVKTNVFIVGEKTEPMLYDERIQLTPKDQAAPGKPFCIPAKSGKFQFSTDGQGRYIIIRS